MITTMAQVDLRYCFARQTVVGPLRVAAQWGRIGGFTVYAGIGFDF